MLKTAAIPRSWICHRCTLVNEIYTKECVACANVNTSNVKQMIQTLDIRIASAATNKDTWQCSKCTFKNKNSKSKCEVCDANKENEFRIPAVNKGRNDSSKPSQSQPLNIELESSSSTAREIEINCLHLGINFVDDAFPPALKSLYLNGKHPTTKSSEYKIDKDTIQWLRPTEMQHRSSHSRRWKVCENPSASDIEQGHLGDCWFIAALALIVDKKKIMDRILVTKELNPIGLYVIRLFQNGAWKDVLVDDCFPCIHNKLVYSRSKKKELWISLIEKAMAKLHGCYEALCGGSLCDGLTVLTGHSTEKIRWDVREIIQGQEFDFDVIWAQLLSSFMAGFIMGTSCGKQYGKVLSKDEYTSLGLKSNHCYSILEVVSIDNLRLLKLHNPWGNFCWNGDWSEKSHLWTKRMREKLSPSNESEGSFWICYDDFLKYFADVYICKLRKGWQELNMEGIFLPYINESEYPVYQLHVTKSTEIDISIYQYFSKNMNLNGRTVDLLLLLIEDRSNSSSNTCSDDRYLGKLIGYSEHRLKPTVNLNCIVSPGKYFIVPMAFLQITNSLYPDFHLKILSAQKVFCERIAMPNKCLIADALMLYAREKATPKPITDNVYLYSTGGNSDASIFVCENKSKRNVQITWGGEAHGDIPTHGVSIGPGLHTTRGSCTVIDVIPAQHRQVITIAFSSQSIKYRWRMETLPSSNALQQGQRHPEINPDIGSLHTPRMILN